MIRRAAVAVAVAAAVAAGCDDRIEHFADAGPNLVDNGTFEELTSPWFGYQSTLARADVAHGGQYSCEVCHVTGDCYSIITGEWVSGPRAGEVYAARAWVRASPDAPPPTSVELHLREKLASGAYAGASSSGSLLVRDGWDEVATRHEVTTDAASLEVYLAGCDGPGGDCFLVDDIELRRE